MTYELAGDYAMALNALPEAYESKRVECERSERIAHYARELITYAKNWSRVRARLRDDPDNNSLPETGALVFPDVLPLLRPYSAEETNTDNHRITNDPTRQDRIEAFAQFVNGESHNLSKQRAIRVGK